MKILHIASKLPWPLIDGARICMYRTIEGLVARGHEVHLVAFDERFTDPGDLAKLATVHVVALRSRAAAIGALLTLAKRRPYTQLKREVPAAYAMLDQMHEAERFDIVIADEIHVASYGTYMMNRHRLPYVLRAHNVEFEIYRRHTSTVVNPLMRAYLEVQTSRWRSFEVEQFAAADAVAAITHRDRLTIESMAPEKIVRTIPAAVDLDAFRFRETGEREQSSMMMLGDMKWPPNRDAALWFVNEILPHVLAEIPDAVLYLIGDNAPTHLLHQSANVRIEGRVADVAPYFARAAVGLIPLRVGGGMRIKMIEMMSSGLPIVSTSQGAEGNEGRPREHFLCADDARSFADAIVELMRSAEERSRLATAGRTFVEQHYSLSVVAREFEQLLTDVVPRGVGHSLEAER